MNVAAEVERHGSWYHVLELGSVVTPGAVDVRSVASVALPDRLDGRRCLDIGTFDGFWAFAMEARGASEVLALDVADPAEVDFPPETRRKLERGELGQFEWGEGFRIAREALGSSVQRIEANVYALDTELTGGPVDFALCGTLLQHLRDPVGALERIRGVLAPGGECVVVETVMELPRKVRDRPLAELRTQAGGLYTWWVASDAALHDYLRTAGFEQIEPVGHPDLPGLTPGDRLAVVRAR